MKGLTEFQEKIREYLEKHALNKMASAWEISQRVFPERWRKRASHGVMIVHIRRAALKALDVFVVLAPRNEHEDYTICLVRE